MNIDQASDHVGATVLYRPNPGTVERGVIDSVNAAYVLVRYGLDARAKATAPELLELAPVGSDRTAGIGARHE